MGGAIALNVSRRCHQSEALPNITTCVLLAPMLGIAEVCVQTLNPLSLLFLPSRPQYVSCIYIYVIYNNFVSDMLVNFLGKTLSYKAYNNNNNC
jgi:hypothetical protein